MKKRQTAALLAFLMLLTACSKNEGDIDKSNDTQEETVEKTTLLTGVFTEKSIEAPEEYNICGGQPYIDSESGNISILYMDYFYDEDSDDYLFGYNYKLCEYDSELNLVNESDVAISSDYISSAVILKDSIVYMESVYENDSTSYYITRYNLADGSKTQSSDVKQLFDTSTTSDWFYIEYIAMDNDGNIYLTADGEILVMNSDFVKQYSIPINSWVYSIARSNDGEMYINSYFDEGMGIAKIDREKKALSEPIYLNDSTSGIFFADGYDFYSKNDYGIYGYNITEDGVEKEEIMNFENSDIYSSSFELIAVLSKDKIIANDRDMDTYENNVVVMDKSHDIDLSQIKVVEIATAEYSNYTFSSKVVKYNKAHKDSRIVVNDYTKYDTPDDYNAGRTKLMNEVSTGVYKPDILICSSDTGTASYFVKNEIFLDLNDFISGDPDIQSDDILDSVKLTFSTSDGKLWGLASNFNVNTLVGKKSELGDKTSWTFDELLDYAASLPEGVSLIDNNSQSNMLYFFDEAFASFIDLENNTCNFENETFYKFLNYLKTLPEESNYDVDYDYDSNYYSQYQNGSVALYGAYIYSPVSFPELQCVFNSKDYTIIGMPTYNESSKGGTMRFSNAYMITKYCENTDVAWDFVKTLLISDDEYYDGFSILKSDLRKLCEKYYDYEFEFYFSGGAMYGTYDKENPGSQENMTEPGILTHFTEEDTELIMNYLNNECGSPIASEIPDEVLSIITEEITSFTGGAKSAEDCARVIQSRVSIYLAEHE